MRPSEGRRKIDAVASARRRRMIPLLARDGDTALVCSLPCRPPARQPRPGPRLASQRRHPAAEVVSIAESTDCRRRHCMIWGETEGRKGEDRGREGKGSRGAIDEVGPTHAQIAERVSVR